MYTPNNSFLRNDATSFYSYSKTHLNVTEKTATFTKTSLVHLPLSSMPFIDKTECSVMINYKKFPPLTYIIYSTPL